MKVLCAVLVILAATASAQLQPNGCPGIGCATGVMMPVVPGSPNWDPLVNRLSAQQKEELFQGNLDQIKSLAFEAYLHLRKLLVSLEDKYDVYVKISNALAGGHNVRFQVVQGESSKVGLLATELGIQPSSDSLYAPGEKPDPNAAANAEKATAAASALWHQAPKPALIPFPERVNKFVSTDAVQSLASGNRQQAANLNPPAAAKVTRLLELLEANKNYIRLHGSITAGHVVDYELINGSRSDLRTTASTLGLEVTDTTISTTGTTQTQSSSSFSSSSSSSSSAASSSSSSGTPNDSTVPQDAERFDADELPKNDCRAVACTQRGPNEAEITIVKSVYIPPN